MCWHYLRTYCLRLQHAQSNEKVIRVEREPTYDDSCVVHFPPAFMHASFALQADTDTHAPATVGLLLTREYPMHQSLSQMALAREESPLFVSEAEERRVNMLMNIESFEQEVNVHCIVASLSDVHAYSRHAFARTVRSTGAA